MRTVFGDRGTPGARAAVTPTGRSRRVLAAMAVAAAGLVGAGLAASPAAAQEHPDLGEWTGTTGRDATAVTTTSEDVTVTVSVAGDHLAIHETQGLNAAPSGVPEADTFLPQVPVDGGWLGLSVSDAHCEPDTTCERGTLTITFSEPVADPVIHLSGLGSGSGYGPAGASQYQLTGSEPAGAELGGPAPGAANLAVADGLVRAANPYTATALCAETAGCGSVPVTGSVTQLTLRVGLLNVIEDVAPDEVGLLVSAPALPPEPEEPEAPVAEPSPPTLPVTGAPALALAGLGAGGLLLGSALFRVRTRARWRGVRRTG